jgi:hypothetical protein
MDFTKFINSNAIRNKDFFFFFFEIWYDWRILWEKKNHLINFWKRTGQERKGYKRK